tara:strand:+ start:12119 stop:15034 length:2916 start_codon:yes stop_codon:yes gene_type:complete
MNKVFLGTANFGLKYGQGRGKIKVPMNEMRRIINSSNDKKIYYLDTAMSYRNEKQLKKLNLKTWNIITKIEARNFSKKQDIKKEAKNYIYSIIKTLRLKKLYGILIHIQNSPDVNASANDKLFDFLKNLKKKKLVKKIGFSVYDTDEVDFILKKYKIDLIQCPLNPFDRRFEKFGYLKKFKKKGIEVHGRSIFLQGLLLLNKNEIPKTFKKWNYEWEKWDEWTKRNNISKLEACLNYINSLSEVNRAVVGVNNFKQLKKIFKYSNSNKKINFSEEFTKDKKLIDPRRWNAINSKKSSIAIIQARQTSKRFPRKILQRVNNLTLIETLVNRLKLCKKLKRIIVAIPKGKKQSNLKRNLKKLKVDIFEGSEENVLDRFYKASKLCNSDFVVRITADCPLMDPKLVDKLVSIAEKKNYDYVSNVNPPTYPDGLDISVISTEVLEEAWRLAKTKFDKEHIVTYIHRNKKLRKYNLENSVNLSGERWTVDEPEDYEVIKRIIENFNNLNFSWSEVMKLKSKKPEIFYDNRHIIRDEGSLPKKLSPGQSLWKRASKLIPGGNMLLSKRPQLFLSNQWPSYFKKAKGCKIWGLDNIEYLDMSLMGVGTNILGYGHPEVDAAVRQTIRKGNMSTLNCPEEVYLSERLVQLHPWSDMAKFTRTGGEANAVAIRIARAASGKDKVAICGYHGWHDWYLAANIKDKKNLTNHLLPDLKIQGVPKALKNTVFSFQYNNLDQLKQIIKKHDVGVVKMEVSKNFRPKNNFLKEVRKLTERKNIILIFDECTSGFRENFGGLHLRYNVEPDMAVFGKALGNGYAINAVIGKRNIMNSVNSSFISSTFWTERIGPTAALKTLEVMEKIKSWRFITKQGKKIKDRWKKLASKNHINISIWGLDPLAGFTINSFNSDKYKTFITQEMLKNQILASNTVYLSIKHSNQYIEKYLHHLDRIFKIIGECEDGREIDDLLEGPISQSTFKRLN